MQTDTFVVFFMVSVWGLFFGSFLNVVADRLSRGETLMGRSHCESCRHTLHFFDLVPVFSFLFLKAKCRYCHVGLSWSYPLSESMTAAVFTLTWWLSISHYTSIFLHIIHVALAAVFVAIILADVKYHLIPDELQISMVVLACIRLAVMYGPPHIFALQYFYWDALEGLVMTLLPIYALYIVTGGRGMGFGDVKFAAGMGLLLGLWGGLMALYLAFVLGGVVGAVLLLSGKRRAKSKIAFGPFLIIGTYIMLFFSEPLLHFFFVDSVRYSTYFLNVFR